MIEYEEMQYQIDIQMDGRYYARIYKAGIPGPIFFTDDFDTKDEAVEAAIQIIDDHIAITGGL